MLRNIEGVGPDDGGGQLAESAVVVDVDFLLIMPQTNAEESSAGLRARTTEFVRDAAAAPPVHSHAHVVVERLEFQFEDTGARNLRRMGGGGGRVEGVKKETKDVNILVTATPRLKECRFNFFHTRYYARWDRFLTSALIGVERENECSLFLRLGNIIFALRLCLSISVSLSLASFQKVFELCPLSL